MASPFLIPPLFLAISLAVAAPALAENSSTYTKLILDQCQQEPLDPEDELQGGVWWCEGYGGMPVRVAEGDLRFLVSYGANAAEELAASQTVPSFNTINETLEWRLDASGMPIATILRFFTDLVEGQKGQVLVITKLGPPGQICHVGYVDALLNPDANVVARDVADNAAPGFVCGEEIAPAFGLTGDDARE
ncbi:hypothetical protein [Bauldia litoralis]|uniref:Uncharacterized protein n=1 Tax=Bauldia litoralis TaxID=665467 RepID=A0A1G6AEJ3_9HYPH|nr:hypothetical protein [Bauldia litoralis]SDB06740.1 hypothetical protein SAMN02982931_00506 [Bauldia litoralis]